MARHFCSRMYIQICNTSKIDVWKSRTSSLRYSNSSSYPSDPSILQELSFTCVSCGSKNSTDYRIWSGCEISWYYMRADVDGSLIRKQWVCAESLARNFMKFQSRVEIVRSYLWNFMCTGRARSRSRRRETIDSAAYYRENSGPDVSRTRCIT